MKRKSILFGGIGIVALTAVVAALPWNFGKQGSYKVKGLSHLERPSASDAQQWMKARYIDQTTGLPVSKAHLEQIRTQVSKMSRNKSISFTEQGPDNIGGRTRAVLIDRTNKMRLWAGGVSGGLFVTTNRANSWERVDSYINTGASPFISSLTQTADGIIFVATGSGEEQFGGDGVWYSSDFGGSWNKVPTVTSCTEVVSDDFTNKIWMATPNGLRTWQVGDANITSVSVGSGSCNSLQISTDGTVLVAAVSANKTYISENSGQTWFDKSGSTSSNLVPAGSARIEYAISKTKNSQGKYSIYASRTDNNLLGMSVSQDNGVTWSQFVGASGSPSNLNIYRDQGTWNSIITVNPTDSKKILIGGIDIWQWQQTVNNPPSGGFEQLTQWFLPPNSSKYAHADNHEMKWDVDNRLYIGNDGGIGITTNFGASWYPANRGYNVTQFYGIAFDRDGAVMGGTQDNGTLYNDHSLSTFMEFQEVGGGDGFECEISFYNPSVMFSSVYYNSISRSGDRGKTFTDFVPTFPSGYDPAGTSGAANNHPFHTEFVLAEYYDDNSKDSVTYLPKKNYNAGALVKVPSLATGDTIAYTTPSALYYNDTVYYKSSLTNPNGITVVNKINNQVIYLSNYTWVPYASAVGTTVPVVNDSLTVNFPTGPDLVVVKSVGTFKQYFAQHPTSNKIINLGKDTVAYNVSWDTLRVQDPYQSWFLMYVNANGGELWGTRNALRLSAQDPVWVTVARGIGGGTWNNIDIEFSKDLNHCFVSAGSGIWRIDGLGSVYTSDPDFATKAGYKNATTPPSALVRTKIVSSGTYEGIALNISNPNDLILFSGFGGATKRTNNALSNSPSFTTLASITSPTNVACYDGIIDREDSDILVVGTSTGVFISEDGGMTWSKPSTNGFDGTPVYEVRQSWRTWAEGNNRPGEIYIGTFGRGIWSTAAYLGIGDNDQDGGQSFKTKLKTYPNPAVDHTTITFNLKETSNVAAYVYNLSGAMVKSVVEKNVSEGTQSLRIDCEDLPRGTYIIKFAAGSQHETVKFIKM